MKYFLLILIVLGCFQCNGSAQQQPPVNQFHKYFRQELIAKGIPQPKDEIAPLESESIWKNPIRSYPYFLVLYDGPNGRILVMAKYLKGLKQYEYDFEYDGAGKIVTKVKLYTPGKGESVFYEKK